MRRIKRIIIVFASLFLTFGCFACGSNGLKNLTKLKSAEEILASATAEEMSGEYDIKKATAPFYTTQIQYNEGFFLLENADGSVNDVTLLFPIAKMLEIRSNDLKTVYKEGEDYEIEDGKIRLTSGSAMKAMPRNGFFLPDNAEADYLYNSNAGADEGKKPTTDKTALYPYRYAATYIRTEIYDGYVPEGKGKKLKNYSAKVKKSEPVSMMYVGDSIGAGAGGSGEFPYIAEMLGKAVQETKNCRVTVRNASVPGLSSSDFANCVITGQYKLIREDFRQSAQNSGTMIERYAKDTDIVIIALGANDCSGKVSSGAFATNIETIIEYFREENPKADIVLVSSMDISHKVKKSVNKGGADLNLYDIEKYADELIALEGKYERVACADVFRFQKSLLEKKQWEDLIADNLNHPCDYMQRMYVQAISATLEKA